jgi:hypothetical protein
MAPDESARPAGKPEAGADNRSSEGLPAIEPRTPEAELPLRGYTNRGAAGYAARDEAVQQAVLEALLEEPKLQARDLAVSIAGGVVTLGGSVGGTEQRALAVRRAAQVAGVREVRDRLQVRSRPPPRSEP